MDTEAWWATVHGVAKSQTWLRQQPVILRGENSPRKFEVLARGPTAFNGRARTMAEDSQLPGLLILASLTRYPGGKLESKVCPRASLVAQWWRIRLPVQEMQVPSLVREDPTCLGAAKLLCHSCWAHVPQLRKPEHPRAHALQRDASSEKPTHCNQRVAPAWHN